LEDKVVPQNKYILSLDQSTSATGWALFKNKVLIDWGVFKTEGYEDSKVEDMRKWLDKKINEIVLDESIDLKLVLEDIQMQRNDVKTFKVLAHLQGVLINTFYRNKEKINSGMSIYYSSEWKSSCGIKGKDRTAQKNNAQKFIFDTFKIKANQDTCDAICLGVHDIQSEESVINFE